MNNPITSGASSYVLWGKESTYKTAVTTDKHFGLDTNFNASLNNNLSGRRGFTGSSGQGRDVQHFTAGKASYDLSIDFDLNDPAFLEILMGSLVTNDFTGTSSPPSMSITNCLDNVTTDRNEIYTGVVLDSASIKAGVDEPVTVGLKAYAATMDYDSTLTSNTALTDKAPFNFVESTFELPNGSAINNIVESFELNINNNYTMLYGSSREAVNAVAGQREYILKLSTKYVDDDLLNKALGGSTIATDTPTSNATFEIVLTRPDNDTLTILGTVAPINTYNLQAQLNNPVEEDIDIVIQSLKITKSIS